MSASDREIVMTRVYDAPRELVWQAMTDPKHLAHWWGPRGFSDTIVTHDFRVGGVWKHIMHGPDGKDYPNKSVFKEIVPLERIVFGHAGGSEEDGGAHFQATWSLEALAPDKTRLTARMVFPTAEARNFVVEKFGAIEGGKQTLEKLREYLPKMSGRRPDMASSDREIVSTRVFNAPRATVFKAFSDRDHLVRWWGPKGFTNTFEKFDLRPGGDWRFAMHSPDGTTYHNEVKFVEVVKPERIVFQHLEPIHHFQMTMTFAEEAGKTRLTWRMLFESDAERAKVANLIREGNEQNFERLAAELEKMTGGGDNMGPGKK